MRHPGDAVCLDHDLAARVLEYLVRKAFDCILLAACRVDPMDVGPLLHFRGRVDRVYNRVRTSLPDRHWRKRSGVIRGMPHEIAPLAGREATISVRSRRAKQR